MFSFNVVASDRAEEVWVYYTDAQGNEGQYCNEKVLELVKLRNGFQ